MRSKAAEFKSPFDMWAFAHESVFGAPPHAAAASDDVLDPSHQVKTQTAAGACYRMHGLTQAQFDEAAIDSVCARKLEQLQQIIVEQVHWGHEQGAVLCVS